MVDKETQSKRRSAAVDLTSQAIEQINELLSTGRLVAGQRLIERDLCELLGIGRVPVREALRVLAGDGVIELVPGRGARVRSMGPREIADMLKVVVGLLFVALDELPALNNKEQFNQGLIEQNERIKEAASSTDPFALIDATYGYQEYITASSGNEYLTHTMKKASFVFYTREVIRYISSMQTYTATDLYDEITAALVGGKFDIAKSLFAETRDQLVKFLIDAELS